MAWLAFGLLCAAGCGRQPAAPQAPSAVASEPTGSPVEAEVSSAPSDPELAITVRGEFPNVEVELENSVFRARLATGEGGECKKETAIRDWVIKATGRDQAGNFIDACAFRPPLRKAVVTEARPDATTVRLEYGDCEGKGTTGVASYTIYPHSPVIRVHYESYAFAEWHNTVDIGSPGGGQGEYAFHGGEKWIRGYDLYPKSYWNVHDGKEYAGDPKDGGALNYKGHLVMAVAREGEGFGRVMPIKGSGPTGGGARIVKLLEGKGFETFPSPGDAKPSFVGYLFVFTGGLEKAIAAGRAIVDGDMRVGKGGP